MTNNLNWEISTKNLVTFRRWDKVNDKKFVYFGSSLKNQIFGGGGGWAVGERCMKKKNFCGGGGTGGRVNRLKRGAWIVCRFKRKLSKRKDHVFEVGRG